MVNTIKNIINEVEKFEGKINNITIRIGIHNGKNEDLKSNFLSMFLDKKLDM